MNPLAIRAENYRTFETLALDLPAGCVAIVGGNGNGKSSTVNVIDLALFGPESRSLADQLTTDSASTEMMIELTFEHAGRVYRVRRGYSARGAGKTTLDLEVALPEDAPHYDWRPMTRENVKGTQAAIEELLGLSRDTFRASTFLKQRDGAAFTDAQPKDRKRILAEILGLDHWDTYADLAKTDRRKAENEVESIRGTVRMAESLTETKEQDARDLLQATGIEETAAANLADAEARLETATTTYQEARALVDAAATAQAELRAATATVERLNETVGRAQQAETQIAGVDADITRLERAAAKAEEAEKAHADIIRRQQELDARTREHEQLLKQAADRDFARLDRLGDAAETREKAAALRGQADQVVAHVGEHRCDRCEQTLGAEAAARAADSYRREADGLDQQAQEIDDWAAIEQAAVADLRARGEAITVTAVDPDDLAAAVTALQTARLAVTQLVSLRERRSMLAEQAAAATPEAFEELERARVAAHAAGEASAAATGTTLTAVQLDALVAAGKTARSDVDQNRLKQTQATADKARLTERLDRIRETEEQITLARAREADLLDEIQVAGTLERAYGRDGIPALIVENVALPQIEAEANRVLAELPTGDGAVFRIELQTQRANKTGGVSDVLDIVVHAPGGERAYETFSEGEKTRLNLALRIALASLLSTRRGADSRCLIVDEPEFLDEQGTQALAQVLRDLVNHGTFDRVFLVSHVPALRDSFDQTIEIVKENNRSRILADLSEPVAA